MPKQRVSPEKDNNKRSGNEGPVGFQRIEVYLDLLRFAVMFSAPGPLPPCVIVLVIVWSGARCLQ